MQTLILIPPSQSKNIGGTFPKLKTINSITLSLIDSINSYKLPEKLYGLKEKALLQTIKINKNILTSKTMPAISRYTGVVYDAIDYSSLKNKNYFDSRIMIVSALFGLVKPQDLIPNYSLKIDKLNSVKLWFDENSSKLKDYFVIDLLPQSHKKAISYENGISVDFIFLKNGKKMPAGHQGKHIKGRFVRWLIENNITDISDFYKFKEDGYSFDGINFIKKI